MSSSSIPSTMLSILLATTLAQSQTSQHKEMRVAEVVRHSRTAVVQIVASDKAGTEISLGTGFLVSPEGKIVTNYHVVRGAFSAVANFADGSRVPVEGALAVDSINDLALLKVSRGKTSYLKPASTPDLHVGDHVIAIGNPLGLEGTVSDGIVSALRKEPDGRHWIQTTAPISPGNSGGPLLDMSGTVVGVLTRQFIGGQNLNFAVPAESVTILLSMSTGVVEPLASMYRMSHYRGAWVRQAKALVQQGRNDDFIALCKQKCDLGAMSACTELAWFYSAGQMVPHDPEKAKSLYQKACNGGHPYACLSLGDLYADGKEVAQDDHLAFVMYKQACEQGEDPACEKVGVFYQLGRGVTKSYEQARLTYEKSCANNYVSSCVELGGLYESGQGVDLDEKKAVALYQQACDAGDQDACAREATLFVYSEQLAPDYPRAHALYGKACDEGEMVACALLSNLYDRGIGVPRNHQRALELLHKACDGGYQPTCDFLKQNRP
jgi:TPR repeat protein